MKYQLVLQWPASSITDYDALIALEDALIAHLPDDQVDGHDFGSGGMNIFIFTDGPQQAFNASREIFESNGLPLPTRAGYRDLEDEDYVVLWPSGAKDFSVL